ncbi:hypothetical protein [Falsirhodobacter sp. 20TX0035]|uniref:hypothetical protein n=1 Tax=Falsirhodobacter sp. 20TX0035 TaxID=3022019 RepID=UPI00232C8A1D|nr:hypothetical protein [Falsirhodobacter sp. 20TX0035]MDB6454429.1 hypothetical protein [Falsirhodobacter sp. 20TX0035]
MFTIEHDFDATIVTLIDEGRPDLQEDVVLHAFDDQITVEQVDRNTHELCRITLSMTQIRDLAAALNLPEGSYRLTPKT